MRYLKVKVESIKKLTSKIYLLSFNSSYIAKNSNPGQFLHIKIDNSLVLRRPFSIHKLENNRVYVLFKVIGKGTFLLSRYRKGDFLDIIGPLGRGFNYKDKRDANILIAGGMGVAPLVFLSQKLDKSALNVVFLGAKSRREILGEEEFKKNGFKINVATEDGSKGFRGKITTLFRKKIEFLKDKNSVKVYACGPNEMFNEIVNIMKSYFLIDAEFSLEQFMGCGLGVCLGCVIETPFGYKRVCKDGPVFSLRELYNI